MGEISTIVRIDLLLYSIILDLIMYVYLKKQVNKTQYSSKLFQRIILSIVLVASIEVISWVTGEIGNQRQISIHYWSNALFLALLSMPAGFAMSYLDYKIFKNKEQSRKRLKVYLIPTYLTSAFAIVNHFDRGFLFYIADTNQYYRGIGVAISIGIVYLFIALCVIYFYKYKRLIAGRAVQGLIIFIFVPIIGALLQNLAYGTTLGMPSYTLAIFLSFLLVEKDEMSRDNLTNLYTRANMESRLRFKLKSSVSFTVMMIDLNDFKEINDTYGHAEGDKVLQKVSEVIKSCTNVEDMVCRYGGDEFLLLIECSDDIGEALIQRIDHQLEEINQCMTDYKVYLSYGFEFVKNPSETIMNELLHRVDKKMYEDKMQRKATEN